MSASTYPSQDVIDQFVGNAHGNFSVVKDLLEKYPSMVNSNATWTETAIQAAAQTGQIEIVRYLLDHGAEYDICTAAMLGELSCVKDFLKEDSKLANARGAHGIPVMYFPVIHGNTDVADYLLQNGADINLASPNGITPLHSAVMFKQPKMASWLLEHGADPNQKYDGKTPLAMAVETKQDDLIQIIRDHGGKE